MPGVNCSVVGCESYRISKGIGIFKLPVAKDEAYRKSERSDWLGEVTKARKNRPGFQGVDKKRQSVRFREALQTRGF